MDVVFRDDFGGLIEGDVPLEAIFFMLYRAEDVFQMGVYIAYRYQWFDEGDMLSVGAYDMFFRWRIMEGEKVKIELMGEGAILEGKSDHLRTLNAPDGVHVLGAGGAVRLDALWKPASVRIVAEAGAASGDADPLDKKARIFSFDPDYNVGLIAYEEVMAGLTAGSAQRVSDPEIVGRPPAGVELLATQGAVTNSFYWTLNVIFSPLDFLTLKAGYLDVWLIAPLTDLYMSTLRGGIAVNAFGLEDPGKHFGREVDLGAEFHRDLHARVSLSLGFEGGVFVKGEALDSPADSAVVFPDQIYKLEARVSLNWK